MKRLILLLCGFVVLNMAHAQNEQQQINAIKSNMDFLYATGVSSVSGESALDNARDLLAVEIEQWLKENDAKDLTGYVAKSKEHMSQIKTQRGKLYRVFVYVKKKDVLPFYNEENMLVSDFVSAKNADVQPVIVASEERKDETDSYHPTETEKAMVRIASFSKLNDYINQGRRDERIVDVGKYSDMPKEGIIYVFIHNRLGEIPACMKVTNGSAVNLITGKEDRISDYKGCGAIWIKIDND